MVEIYSQLVLVLGFVGLGAVGVIPVRSWWLVRRMTSTNDLQFRRVLGSGVTILAVVSVLLLDANIVLRVFRCLTQDYCGPSIASGWGYLAVLGAAYLVFEIVALCINGLLSESQVARGR